MLDRQWLGDLALALLLAVPTAAVAASDPVLTKGTTPGLVEADAASTAPVSSGDRVSLIARS